MMIWVTIADLGQIIALIDELYFETTPNIN